MLHGVTLTCAQRACVALLCCCVYTLVKMQHALFSYYHIISHSYHNTPDVLHSLQVIAVGEQSATFGVPGVSEYCFFMKARHSHDVLLSILS